MSAVGTGAILVGYDQTDTWGSLQRRPILSIFLIHFGTPVLARESATFPVDAGDVSPWRFPASMICRPDPVDFAYDLAYFVAIQTAGTGNNDTALPAALDKWPEDPREDNGFKRRTALHETIQAVVTKQPRMRLQLVRFEPDPLLGPDCVDTLGELGFEVEVFARDAG
ncbi:MAG: hypothetical protein H6525_04955 [Actinobacteria bacterium]|nr:hypothetical protein [Actinomycetota bacterium]